MLQDSLNLIILGNVLHLIYSVNDLITCILDYIYIYAFSRQIYP